jgi:hypothetical protein
MSAAVVYRPEAEDWDVATGEPKYEYLKKCIGDWFTIVPTKNAKSILYIGENAIHRGLPRNDKASELAGQEVLGPAVLWTRCSPGGENGGNKMVDFGDPELNAFMANVPTSPPPKATQIMMQMGLGGGGGGGGAETSSKLDGTY